MNLVLLDCVLEKVAEQCSVFYELQAFFGMEQSTSK